MSAHLDKAKGALEEAKNHDNGSLVQLDLLNIARTQAAIAQAEAMERLVVLFEERARV